MNWLSLESIEQIDTIINKSFEQPQIIFKHSTRCSISSVVKNRLDKNQNPDKTDFYYLDLISHRNISNQIAETFNVPHESPQILLIKNGECIFDESHSSIYMEEITDQLASAN
jgi:bacillithiol system protein YtxJ